MVPLPRLYDEVPEMYVGSSFDNFETMDYSRLVNGRNAALRYAEGVAEGPWLLVHSSTPGTGKTRLVWAIYHFRKQVSGCESVGFVNVAELLGRLDSEMHWRRRLVREVDQRFEEWLEEGLEAIVASLCGFDLLILDDADLAHEWSPGDESLPQGLDKTRQKVLDAFYRVLERRATNATYTVLVGLDPLPARLGCLLERIDQAGFLCRIYLETLSYRQR